MTSTAAAAAATTFLAGGGELGALIRAHDWTSTALGPPEVWPQSLKTAVRIMLTSRQPIWIGWGPELVYLYNDAYKSIIGGKHPWALGRPTKEVWREIWPDIGPMLATAMGGVEGTFVEEQLLIMERNGYPEETYYTFSYSPVPDDDGAPGGIICANSEDTPRVVGERQIALLRDLAAETVDARAWREACERALRAVARNPRDITFALLYVAEPGADQAELAAATGLEAGSAEAPLALSLADGATWPVGEVARRRHFELVDLQARGLAPRGAWDRPSTRAVALPVAASSDTGREAVLIAGLSPYRQFDEGYRSFLGLVAGQISAAIASADAYEEERRRSEALAELDRAKTAFFSNVSHEFRTPLTLILGPLEELLASGAANEETLAQVRLAHRNGTRLLRLVNSLLDFSRIEAGRVRALYEPVDLAAYSAEIASSFRSAVEKAGLEFEIVTGRLEGPVYVDRDMWEKVLLNLLSNAFKFTLEGRIRVEVEPAPDGQGARVSVADTGIGIPAEELPKLFERFHRVEGAQGRSFEGTGIGLALVNELVGMHGGDISVASAPGVGTRFTVRLPYGRAHLPADQVREGEATAVLVARAHEYLEEALRWFPDAGEASEAAGEVSTPGLGALAASGAERPGAGRRIVLADDNGDMRGYVQRLLEAQGYEVEGVEDGVAALEAIRRAPPDLLLSDVMMPRLDGFGLLRELRADPRTRATPVIMLSARAGEEAKIEGLDAGADDYLVKPFAARELLARVNANIQITAVRREADRAIWASEQRYRISEERLGIALSSGGVGVFEWRLEEGRVAMLGPVARLFGVSPEVAATEGYGVEDYLAGIHPEDRDRVAAAVDRSRDAKVSLRAEYRVVGGGEERQVVAFGDWHERAAEGLVLAGAIIDVTDLRRAQRELEQLNSRLEERVAEEVAERARAEEALRQAQKMEAVGQLTGGIAHDFNNLLTVIIGGLETAGRCRPEEEARRRRAVDLALQGAQRAASLTSRLLAFSRRQPLAPKAIDLNVLVRDMTDLLHRTLGETIELEGVLAPRLWTVDVDENQLESAILNLAVNARDAMPEGGKLTIETANTELDAHYAARDAEVVPGQYVMVSVSDTGSGMSKDTLERVFEPFFTTKEVGRGTGLGLSMVYGFVKQSGGHVTIYSEEGEGTTVRLYFPRHHAAATAETAASVEVPRSPGGEVILVVEDNEDVRTYSVQVLEELGYTVLEAAESDEALRIVQSAPRLDLLFTDVVLPGRNGRVVAELARDARPELKVLFTTGYSRNAIVHHGRLDPGVELITKPFTFEQLGLRVRDLLDGR